MLLGVVAAERAEPGAGVVPVPINGTHPVVFGHGTGDYWFVDFLPAAWGSPNAAKPSVSLCTAPREVAS